MVLDNENLNEININKVGENNAQDKQKIDVDLFDSNTKTIGHIKNVIQEKKKTEKSILETTKQTNLQIKTFGCSTKFVTSSKSLLLISTIKFFFFEIFLIFFSINFFIIF